MNLTISPPIKILALVGLIAAVAFVASTMLLGHSATPTRTSTAQPHSGRIVHHVPAAPAAHTTVKPHATAKKHTTTVQPAHAGAKSHAKPIAKTHAKPAKAATRGNLVYADLPAPLQWELALHKIVVVSLYNPNADVDAISVAEAHDGATDAGAGFLLVNVLDNKLAGPLTALLPGGGLLPDPGVLVYRAPGDIMVRLNGFADRTTVSQAATNALMVEKTGTPPAAVNASAATPVAAGTTGTP